MGCYDTVNFRCPSCSGLNSLQTKAGRCNLDTYELHGQNPPPPEIAGGLAAERVACKGCGKSVGFNVICIVNPYVVESSEEADQGDSEWLRG